MNGSLHLLSFSSLLFTAVCEILSCSLSCRLVAPSFSLIQIPLRVPYLIREAHQLLASNGGRFTILGSCSCSRYVHFFSHRYDLSNYTISKTVEFNVFKVKFWPFPQWNPLQLPECFCLRNPLAKITCGFLCRDYLIVEFTAKSLSNPQKLCPWSSEARKHKYLPSYKTELGVVMKDLRTKFRLTKGDTLK